MDGVGSGRSTRFTRATPPRPRTPLDKQIGTDLGRSPGMSGSPKVTVGTIRKAQAQDSDPRERRSEWGSWLLVLFILEESAAALLIAGVVFAMSFALFFESGLRSPDFDQTPFLIVIGGFLVLSTSILILAVRKWTLRSWTCFALPLLVPVAALISGSVWNSLA